MCMTRTFDMLRPLLFVQVTYLKIDIEGSEYDVMAHWHELDLHLPLQVCMY